MENYEPDYYTEKVIETCQTLRDQVITTFCNKDIYVCDSLMCLARWRSSAKTRATVCMSLQRNNPFVLAVRQWTPHCWEENKSSCNRPIGIILGKALNVVLAFSLFFQVMPKFEARLETSIGALMHDPPEDPQENEFIDSSRLVYDGVREIRWDDLLSWHVTRVRAYGDSLNSRSWNVGRLIFDPVAVAGLT